MSDVKKHYDKKSSSFDVENERFHFKVHDAITWKYTEPFMPKNPKHTRYLYEKPDPLGLVGHLQGIGYKKSGD